MTLLRFLLSNKIIEQNTLDKSKTYTINEKTLIIKQELKVYY